MKQKLTVKFVNTLQPKKQAYDVYDTEIAGFVIRVRPSGTKSYLLFYRNTKGEKRTHTIGKSLTATQARDSAQLRIAEVSQGIDINKRDKAIREKAQRIKKNTFTAFLTTVYKPWLLDNRKSALNAYNRLNNSFITLHNKQLNEICEWDIEIWKKQRKRQGTSDSTLKNDLAELKAMIQRAKRWGYIDINQIYDFKYGKFDDNKRDRYLSDMERKRLYWALDDRENQLMQDRESGNEWRKKRGYELMSTLISQAFVDYLKPLILLANNTGLRRGELFALQWADINFTTRQLKVKKSKSAKPRYVPLNEIANNTLLDWKKQAHATHVFTNKDNKPLTTIKKSWASLMEKASIENFRFHDLRHDFASQLVVAGVDLYLVKDLLGHSTIQVTERYAHLTPQKLEQAVNLLNR